MLVALMYGFHINGKKPAGQYFCMTLLLKQWKCSVFSKTKYDRQLKVDTLQQYGMQDKGKCNENEPPLTEQNASSHPKVAYMIGLEDSLY